MRYMHFTCISHNTTNADTHTHSVTKYPTKSPCVLIIALKHYPVMFTIRYTS